MKRLRDEEAVPGSVEGAAADLLRAARPLDISPLARGRVRVGLARVPASPTGWLLRPAVVMALLLLGATVAGASFGARLLARGRAVVVPVVAPAPTPRPPVAPAVAHRGVEGASAPPAAEPVADRRAAHRHPRAPRGGAGRARRPCLGLPSWRLAALSLVDDPALVATALRGAAPRARSRARGRASSRSTCAAGPHGRARTEEGDVLRWPSKAAARLRQAPRAPGEWPLRYLRRLPRQRFRDVVSRSAPSP